MCDDNRSIYSIEQVPITFYLKHKAEYEIIDGSIWIIMEIDLTYFFKMINEFKVYSSDF